VLATNGPKNLRLKLDKVFSASGRVLRAEPVPGNGQPGRGEISALFLKMAKRPGRISALFLKGQGKISALFPWNVVEAQKGPGQIKRVIVLGKAQARGK